MRFYGLLVQPGHGAGGGLQGIVVRDHQALDEAQGNVLVIGGVVAGVQVFDRFVDADVAHDGVPQGGAVVVADQVDGGTAGYTDSYDFAGRKESAAARHSCISIIYSICTRNQYNFRTVFIVLWND